MQRAGLLVRRPDPKDRCGKLIVLTDPGHERRRPCCKPSFPSHTGRQAQAPADRYREHQHRPTAIRRQGEADHLISSSLLWGRRASRARTRGKECTL